ncbi:MAG TPA: FAD synthetase family protein [Rectinemataceae bacterium]|nr:FAD synthetase family protein [Rectinemataceae bacterium]
MSWSEFVASRQREPFAVTIGVFDGVHRGHQRLLDTVLSKRPAMRSAAVTFANNPKKILHPQAFRGSIFSLQQKIDAFTRAGFDACVLIDFSQNFGTLSGAEFLSLLADSGVKFVCVGPNFRCGHKMDTNAQALVEICGKLGMEARIAEPVMYNGHAVSSSRIRNAILEGRLGEASDMLGRPHTVEIEEVVARGFDGFTMKPAEDTVLPPEGIYRIIVDPDKGNEMISARIGEGKIIAGSFEQRGAKRVAIINLVSQEW